MSAMVTPDTCKTIMEYTAIEVSIDDLSHIGTKEAVFFYKSVRHGPVQASLNDPQRTGGTVY